MSFDYAPSIELARRLIDRFGATSTLRKKVQTGPDWAPETLFDDTETVAAQFEVRKRNADGSESLATRKVLYLKTTAAGVVPAKNDQVAFAVAPENAWPEETIWMTLEEVKPFSPAGVDIFYEALITA